jgi:hypothetical protein
MKTITVPSKYDYLMIQTVGLHRKTKKRLVNLLDSVEIRDGERFRKDDMEYDMFRLHPDGSSCISSIPDHNVAMQISALKVLEADEIVFNRTGQVVRFTNPVKDSSKEKDDACISADRLVVWDKTKNQYGFPPLSMAYTFNLMSKEEFYDRHPRKLRFKEWEVKDHGEGSIKVGCKYFDKTTLNRILQMNSLLEHHDVEWREAMSFLKDNASKLGLVPQND